MKTVNAENVNYNEDGKCRKTQEFLLDEKK
ncbi:hypothetical protein SAMN05216324_10618 [Chryseobacterium limigenitum]|uniref:Uncharacterized protein n=1 Tax=Chryseobacterium limigenitum TaxID=1612149 RepID=A0A1K2INM9_9FLAO|nr:hypothetical protein SAMN05216324_10618 [Chryseobacterium limigenitum]